MYLTEIADYLSACKGLQGRRVYCGFMPDDSAESIALFERPGSVFPYPEACDDEILALEIDVRNLTYESACSDAYGVYFALDRLYDVTLGGHRYTYLTAMRPPYHLGRDAALRHWFRISFIVYRESEKAEP